MLRLHLPPNLAAAVGRDAIPIKVELDLAVAPPPSLLPVLATLQRLCGSAPSAFIQLTRAQLRELAAAAGDQPIFQHQGQLGVWRHASLLAPTPTNSTPAPGLGTSQPKTQNSKPKTSSNDAARALVVDGSENFLALTLPSPEHPQYARALDLVKSSGFALEPSSRKWWLRDRHKTLNFLATHSERLRTVFDAEFTANFAQHTARLRPAEILANAAEVAGGYTVTLGLRAGTAGEAVLREALATNRHYLESDGNVFLLEPAKLEQLATAQRALAGNPDDTVAPRRTQRISAAQIADVDSVIEELAPGFQPPATWQTRSASLRNLSRLAPAPIAESLNAQLRPYQRLGVAWLWHLHQSQLAGILADEMGLGKTLQAIALLSALKVGRVITNAPERLGTTGHAESNRRVRDNPPYLSPHSKPQTQNSKLQPASLVVAPASLLENWRRETLRFAPELRVFIHHSDRRLGSAGEFNAYDLVITSYGTLTRDQELFASIEFGIVVADEAQHIKNRRSQNAAALRSLRAHSRFLLTGTPLENSLDDLRSLFEFLLPGYLTRVPAGIRGDERAWFDERLRAQTAPYILRRTKVAVAPELPEKLEQIIWCEFTAAQGKLYRETQEASERQLLDLAATGASESRLQFAALTQLLRLRQICCDPRLVAAGRTESEVVRVIPNATERLGTTGHAEPNRRVRDNAPYLDSAKLEAFRELLSEAIDDGHRILVFSQFTSLLALLREELEAQEIAHCYLDGSMTPRDRQAEVDRFQGSNEIPLFLLSLKAGGTGLNLTGADTVIHFDPWWNPAAEAQATDRAHRIGQTRAVTSYKLICAGSVEEKVLALQTEKRALLADVFEASDAIAGKLSLSDLRDLLK